MDEIKRRGPQYFLLILIIFSGFFTAIYFKSSSKTTKEKEMVKKEMVTKMEAKQPETSSLEMDTVSQKMEESSQEKMSIKEAMEKEMMEKPENSTTYYEALYKSYQAVKNETRNDVVIRYYRKNKDGDIIDNLKDLGFYIHERPTAEALKDLYTNTIYYGDSVKREDILIVAYQLKKAGMQLQAVEHSRFGDNWKSHSIELGTDTTKLEAPALSLDSIKYIIQNNPYLKTHL